MFNASTQEFAIVQRIDQIPCALPDGSGGHTCHDDERGHVVRHHSSRGHDGAFAHDNTRQQDGPGTNKHAIPNAHGSASIAKGGTIGVMLEREDGRTLRDADVIADLEAHASVQEHIAVDHGVCADLYPRRSVEATIPMDTGVGTEVYAQNKTVYALAQKVRWYPPRSFSAKILRILVEPVQMIGRLAQCTGCEAAKAQRHAVARPLLIVEISHIKRPLERHRATDSFDIGGNPAPTSPERIA
jgi:hypothetical protein